MTAKSVRRCCRFRIDVNQPRKHTIRAHGLPPVFEPWCCAKCSWVCIANALFWQAHRAQHVTGQVTVCSGLPAG